MTIITQGGIRENAFSASAVLRGPKWRFYSLPEFLRASFPEPDHAADMFSGIGRPDFFIIRPNLARRGKFLLITLISTAGLLQVGELYRVRSDRIHFCVCQPDAITGEDLKKIIEDAPSLNGLQLDLGVLTSEERALTRSMPIRSYDVSQFLDAVEGKEVRQ